MSFEDFKKNVIPNLLFLILVSSCIVSFFLIFHNQKPDYELWDKSYQEKRLYINPYYNESFFFITKNVESESTVLFLNYQYYSNLKDILYPNIFSLYIEYTDDENLYDNLEQESIKYIVIIDISAAPDQKPQPHHLSSNTYLFSKIDLNSQIYLLEVNRTRL